MSISNQPLHHSPSINVFIIILDDSDHHIRSRGIAEDRGGREGGREGGEVERGGYMEGGTERGIYGERGREREREGEREWAS